MLINLNFYILAKSVAETSIDRKNYIRLDGSATIHSRFGHWPKWYLAEPTGNPPCTARTAKKRAE